MLVEVTGRKRLGFYTTSGQKRQAGIRPNLEALEDRWAPTVTPHGGPVLDHVEIQPVYLGSAWSPGGALNNNAITLNAFLQNLPSSNYMDMLTWAGYGVNRGSALAPVFDNVSVPATI